ncbi:hypothetical protein MPER_08113 [Moniliophthora perniciosa FA553]|nr:hypothetical protein MPER_08113 [Moniliophthora perniciosa FA553]
MCRYLYVALLATSITVIGAEPLKERRDFGDIIDDITQGAGSLFNEATAGAASVFTEVTAGAGSLFDQGTSLGEGVFMTVISSGATGAGVVVTSFAGHEFTALANSGTKVPFNLAPERERRDLFLT